MATKARLGSVSNAGPKQTTITAQAVQLVELAINTPAFASGVLQAHYTGRWQEQVDGSRVERSPAEVLRFILDGVERGTSPDLVVDIAVHYQKMKRYVVGATDLGALPIRTSFRFVNACIADNDAASLAAHYMHEWMHVAGFYHNGGNRARGDVPYVVGDIVHKVLTDLGHGSASDDDPSNGPA